MKPPTTIICFIATILGITINAQVPSAVYPRFNFPPAPPDPKELRIKMDVETVLLDVSVRDKRGQWVSGLTQEDFKVVENGEPQTIDWFTSEDIPVTLGIIFDNSASMRPKRPEAVTAALAFARTSNPHDEIFVVTFNDRVRLALPEKVHFTDDPVKLRDALILLEPEGRTALYDAIFKGLEHAEVGSHGRKALLVISDGGDNSSSINWREMEKLALESRATIFTIGIFNPEDKDKNPGVLKQLARITGGEAYMPKELAELSGICELIAKDIRNRYLISYTPDHKKPVGRERKIDVDAQSPERGKMSVTTRTKYLAPSAAGAGSAERSAQDRKSGAGR
jgi:VWFA-related protein